MFKMTRRAALRGSGTAMAATSFAIVGKAQAAEFAYKYANNLPIDHPLNIRTRQAAERIRKDTNGRLDIQIFPDNQLGSDTDALSQLRSGAIDFFTLSGLVFGTVMPVAQISGIGFAFANNDEVFKAMDGELGAFIRANIAKTEVVAMEKIWDQGFRQITSSTRPILKPKDLDGFKIRVPVSPLWTSMFKAFGASPISINSSEMYSALQTKIAEGQETPLVSIWALKIYEVQKQLSMTNHMWDGIWMLANKRSWNALPDDVRAIAAKHINEAALDQRKDIQALNDTLRSNLETKGGMVFHEVDHKAFQEKLRSAGFYDQWKKTFGDEAWSILMKYSGNI
jgi:TRAP-type transport system periplasmic protein